MKKAKLTLILILSFAVVPESRGQKQANNNDLITVDVTKNYSHKEELILQNFMDVEYIALETNDDFVNQGVVQAIGKEIVLITNRNDDGNIFVYDRTGKSLRKINRKGQGGEEYTRIYNITLDEDNGEMFVSDTFNRKIYVYDLYGKFKRSFKHKKKPEEVGYRAIFNYDKDHLICYDEHNEKIAFVLISKQDGSITKEIKIPFKEKKSLIHILSNKDNSAIAVTPGPYRSIIPFSGNWILSEPSSDTVFHFLPDYSLRPFLVRTPFVQSMDPEVLLILRLFSDRYYFMETIKNVYNFDTKSGFPRTYIIYDRQEKVFSGYIVYNGDYTTKKEVYMNATNPVNHEIESWYRLEAFQLVESYKKGELKGKLKEIAATLDEEDNPVIMLIKHKK
jgi:hypothetical protein